ncbi:exodeoxyribonuclease VII small subunit [Gayadomonas joobiniege]|uniref:exodeoxyribonuclease VII small subunit n=1 Tax=Gayadomonas joobiniege TaxID=1234606 RepID=UPI0003676C48|nr:exodeoxyribonuclease VII small subunit [Gayadomonas joobiniege]
MAVKKPENMSLEDNLLELEQLVGQLENADISLDDALKQYERGIQLVRASQLKLETAEQKIRVLQQKNGQPELVETDEQSLRHDD